MSVFNKMSGDEALKRARTALAEKDLAGARKFSRLVTKSNPDNEEGWLILASASEAAESITYLKRALEINPASKKARSGMRWAAKRLKEAQQADHDTAQKKAAKPPRHVNRERNWGLSLFFTIVFCGTLVMLFAGLPALKAQASVQPQTRDKNVLQKPTLTPTITPTPTMTPTPTATPTPEPTPTADAPFPGYYYHSWDIPEEVSGTNDFWIEVDLSGQMLYAYRGDMLLNSFVVSTGTSSYPTVTGAFKIYSMHPTYTMVGPGYDLPDVPYAMFFHKGYSIHGTYWHSNFGTPMSHGCVNMHTADASWVYQQSTIGTYVYVHY